MNVLCDCEGPSVSCDVEGICLSGNGGGTSVLCDEMVVDVSQIGSRSSGERGAFVLICSSIVDSEMN